MNKYSKLSTYVMIATMLLGIFFVIAPSAFAATSMSIVNPANGTNNFIFLSDTTHVMDTFAINLTITDVTDLGSWQAKVTWDPTLLEFVSFTFPTDNVMATHTPIGVPGDGSIPGETVGGVAAGPGGGSFTGSGTLAVVTLKIIQGVSLGNPHVTCAISYANIGADTFLLDSLGSDIPETPINGLYDYTFVEVPIVKPSFYLLPATIKPANLGDIFGVDVMVSNVDPSLQIVGFQFSIMWNTSLIAPAAPIFANGTFLEAFQYGPGGVIYATDINTHERSIPLTPIAVDYNYSVVGELLMPDALTNFTYHAPFPAGGGRLCTLYFMAILETISPVQIISSIDFIAEDFLVLTDQNLDIGYASATGAVYYAPQKVLGLSIDVYTQYPNPFGGQGANMTSDSFGPQQEVCLFALVTYNDYPVQQKLVGFQIVHDGFIFTREATTDADGIASVCFRLPWPCVDPVGEIFGWWYVNATVEVAEQVVVDNLKFWVWWPVEVVSIEPKFTSVIQTKQGTEMCFEMIYRRFDVLPLNATLTATVYDELGFFIGSASTVITNFGATGEIDPITGEPIPIYGNWTFCIPIPSNAVVGKCIIYGNAFTDWPWMGGVPYCPEVTNTIDFFIAKA